MIEIKHNSIISKIRFSNRKVIMKTKLKKIASLLTIILFIVSCNNSQNTSTKEKELAVKEKELMAKENSLLSKENELLKKEMQSNKDNSSENQ